ncbi:MAG: nitroreductase, partial [Anaerolineae bacterium]|nr:nitroreductase [Anaerolineae bacterium]
MTIFRNVLVHGAILSLVASAVLLITLRINPRLYLQDYPEIIQEAAPPKTPQEKRLALLLGIPFLLLLVAGPLLSTLDLKRQSVAAFWPLFANAFGVGFFFNLVDLLVLDWLLFCTLTPAFMVIPGAEDLAAYKDYGYHFRAFLTGTLLSV